MNDLLETPRCPTCSFMLLTRWYAHADGTPYVSGEKIIQGDIFEIIVCPRCDRK